MNFPERVLESPFGKVKVWATSATHVGVRTNSVIVVNKVPMTLRADIHPEKSKTYSVPLGGGWYLPEHRALSLSKVRDNGDGTFASIWPDAVSDAAHTKVIEKLLMGWLIPWLSTGDGKALIREADLADTKSKLGAIRVRLDQIDTETQKLRAEREHLLAKLAQMEVDKLQVAGESVQ